MRDGSSQEFTKAGVLNYLKFDEYTFDLSDFLSAKDEVRYKVPDRYLHELLFPDLSQDWERQNRVKMLAEANARLATPLYAIAFMAMALAAVIGGSFSRLGYVRRIAVVMTVAAVVRILGVAVQALCDNQIWANVLQYAIPLAACIWAFRQLFRQPVSRFVPLSPLTGSTLMASRAT
jgi:lipopolysaccharide export system permease protein